MSGRLRSLVKSLRGVARDHLTPPTTSDIAWPGGQRITALRPVKPVRGHVINKFNHVVLRGEHAGAPVKLYEADSVEHATFLEALAVDARVARWFPAIVGRSGRSLLTAWVDGTAPAEPVAIEQIIELQVTLHGIAAAELPPSGWNFWASYLRPRFLRAADMLGERVDDLVAIVDDEDTRAPRVAVHLDLKPSNLIVEPSGITRTIDNESCSVSALPLLDICHTARAVRTRAPDYWRRYRARAAPACEPRSLAALEIAWLARLVGSFFVAGQLSDAATLIRDRRAGRSLLPFDPRAT